MSTAWDESGETQHVSSLNPDFSPSFPRIFPTTALDYDERFSTTTTELKSLTSRRRQWRRGRGQRLTLGSTQKPQIRYVLPSLFLTIDRITRRDRTESLTSEKGVSPTGHAGPSPHTQHDAAASQSRQFPLISRKVKACAACRKQKVG